MSRLAQWSVALILVVLGLALAGWLAMRPWLAPPAATPSAIERTWARVEQWAAASRHPGAPITALNAALDHLQRAKLADDDWDPSRPPQPVTDPEAQRALAALVEWSASGGLGEGPCIGDPGDLEAPPPRFVAMFRLARLALAASPRSDDPQFVAAMRLGAHLRSRGPLVAGAVGFSIAREALAVAEARGQPLGPAFVAFAPRREEVVPLLAREAACSYAMAEAAFSRGTSDLGKGTTIEPDGWASRWSATWVGPERELAMAKWYLGERVAAAAAAGDDLTAVAATQVLPDDPDALPASLLVRALASDAASVITDIQAELARYTARVGPPPA